MGAFPVLLCFLGWQPRIPKAVTGDIWSSGFQHTFPKSCLRHSWAVSNALERSQARGCFSKHVTPCCSPTSEGCGVSLSCCGKLGCHFGFRRAIKAQFFIFIRPSGSAQSTSENLWSFSFFLYRWCLEEMIS